MQKYKRLYLELHGLTIADWIQCAIPNCGQEAVDLHHVLGRGKYLNDPTTLLPLCRSCHIKAHSGKLSKEFFLSLLHN